MDLIGSLWYLHWPRLHFQMFAWGKFNCVSEHSSHLKDGHGNFLKTNNTQVWVLWVCKSFVCRVRCHNDFGVIYESYLMNNTKWMINPSKALFWGNVLISKHSSINRTSFVSVFRFTSPTRDLVSWDLSAACLVVSMTYAFDMGPPSAPPKPPVWVTCSECLWHHCQAYAPAADRETQSNLHM